MIVKKMIPSCLFHGSRTSIHAEYSRTYRVSDLNNSSRLSSKRKISQNDWQIEDYKVAVVNATASV